MVTSSSLWDDIGYMFFHLKMFPVEQKQQKLANSFIDNNKKNNKLEICAQVAVTWITNEQILRSQ